MLNMCVFFCCIFCLLGAFRASANVVLMRNNFTLSFDDIEANFAPSVKRSGKYGTLYVAEPLDACSPLTNKIVPRLNDTKSPFVLIIKGSCSFEVNVRRAQIVGFKAAVVYDNEDGELIAMAEVVAGIRIHAVFVSKDSGETLTKYAGDADMELWIVPNFGLLSEALGLDSSRLIGMDCGEGLTFVGDYYHACPQRELTLGATEHTDDSFLSVVLQDQIGGLQISIENQWIDIPPVSGALVVNIGEYNFINSNSD